MPPFHHFLLPLNDPAWPTENPSPHHHLSWLVQVSNGVQCQQNIVIFVLKHIKKSFTLADCWIGKNTARIQIDMQQWKEHCNPHLQRPFPAVSPQSLHRWCHGLMLSCRHVSSFELCWTLISLLSGLHLGCCCQSAQGTKRIIYALLTGHNSLFWRLPMAFCEHNCTKHQGDHGQLLLHISTK